jgi:hypothetical protein
MARAAHRTVYREPGRYAGWPANYGIWSWGDEIVLGFTAGYTDPNVEGHRRSRARPFETLQARSLDGGETWLAAPMPCHAPGGRALSANEHQIPELQINARVLAATPFVTPDADVDFTHPDFALMCARTGLGAGATSWFSTSTDRCRSWQGPFRLPDFSQPGIAARTDYLVSGPGACTLFLTAAKADGNEGRVFCARTGDGGRSFDFVAWLGAEPAGFSIMPSSIRLSPLSIVTAVRRAEAAPGGGRRCWIELYRSDDDGVTWTLLGEAADTGSGGNPPSMLRLQDGRFALIYGYRDPPTGIRARLSVDEGVSWSEEIILRADGGDGDLGYPRSVQRPDGKVVTAYYFNTDPRGDRFIGATLWDPV